MVSGSFGYGWSIRPLSLMLNPSAQSKLPEEKVILGVFGPLSSDINRTAQNDTLVSQMRRAFVS